MGRIRSIKPEFPQSESVGKLSRDGRLLFLQLFTLVDDEGRTRAASRMLASLLYPYDEDVPDLIEGWLAELQENSTIQRYTVHGQTYLEITNFKEHQKIDRPSKSKLPAPPDPSRDIVDPSRINAQDQGRDQGRDQGEERIMRADALPPAPFDADPEEEIPDGLAPTQYAGFVAEQAGIPAGHSTLLKLGDAIGILAREEQCGMPSATKRLLERLRGSQRAGPVKIGFWLEERRWALQTTGVSTEGWDDPS